MRENACRGFLTASYQGFRLIPSNAAAAALFSRLRGNGGSSTRHVVGLSGGSLQGAPSEGIQGAGGGATRCNRELGIRQVPRFRKRAGLSSKSRRRMDGELLCGQSA